jgi:hypothetical protein
LFTVIVGTAAGCAQQAAVPPQLTLQRPDMLNTGRGILVFGGQRP